MEQTIIRLLKPLALALLCFGSIYYLIGSFGTALVVSLVPLILGWLGIMESFAYSIVAIIFIVAVGWAVVPEPARIVIAEKMSEATVEAKQHLKMP